MSDRIKVRNGGKIVRVTKNELEKYLTKGYEIIGEKLSEDFAQPTPEIIPDAERKDTLSTIKVDTTPTRKRRNK